MAFSKENTKKMCKKFYSFLKKKNIINTTNQCTSYTERNDFSKKWPYSALQRRDVTINKVFYIYWLVA